MGPPPIFANVTKSHDFVYILQFVSPKQLDIKENILRHLRSFKSLENIFLLDTVLPNTLILSFNTLNPFFVE